MLQLIVAVVTCNFNSDFCVFDTYQMCSAIWMRLLFSLAKCNILGNVFVSNLDGTLAK